VILLIDLANSSALAMRQAIVEIAPQLMGAGPLILAVLQALLSNVSERRSMRYAQDHPRHPCR
jgi:hypothetical protein